MDRLSNTVRPYAWGSTTAIPALLGIAPTGEPQAEMWMGAHPERPHVSPAPPRPARSNWPSSTPSTPTQKASSARRPSPGSAPASPSC